MSQKPAVDAIFCAAIEINSADQRQSYLNHACSEDAELLRQVERLLQAHYRGGSIVDAPVAIATSGQAGVLPQHQLGDFRLIRELGRGGMGTVYEAEQLSIGRRVALKVLPFAALVQQTSLQRFRNEARAAAALDHPHIVSIYTVGEERGVHYYAMQLIRGQSLADVIDELRSAKSRRSATPAQSAGEENGDDHAATMDWAAPSTPRNEQARISTALDSHHATQFYRSVARLGIQAAEALQYAHDHGVLHRDIKPSNLMLDAEAQLYITDFGLARIEADVGITVTGNIVGTLRYMAPEQALAKRVVIDHRADVYSLGATLYELLTLQPAFGETDRSQLLKQIAFEELTPLRKLDRRIPVDLETIVLNAMAKNPDERYQTAQQLADDLRAFLENRPIQARPPTLMDRAAKWSRRHVAAVWATAALFLLSAFAAAFTAAMIYRANERTEEALVESHQHLDEAQRLRIAAQKKEHAVRQLLYVADMKFAGEAVDAKRFRQGMDLVDRYLPTAGEPDFRRFEWYCLWRRSRSADQEMYGSSRALCIAFSPDGRLLASPSSRSGEIELWDVTTQKVSRSLRGHRFRPTCVDFSSDGKVLASGGGFDDEPGEVMLWEVATGRELASFDAGPVGVGAVAFSPDGKTLAIGTSGGLPAKNEGGEIILWDVTAGKVKTRFKKHSWGVCALAFSPDGQALASSSFDERVTLWNAGDTSELMTLNIPPRGGLDGCNHDIAFSPDGQLLAVTNAPSYDIGLWDWHVGRVTRTLDSKDRTRHLDMALAADGKRIAAAGGGGAVYCWDMETGKLIGELVTHQHWVFALAISPLDGTIASTGWKDGLKFWRLDVPADVPRLPSSSYDWDGLHRRLMATDAAGDTLAMVTKDQSIAVVDAKRRCETARIAAQAESVQAITFSPDGMALAVVHANSEADRDVRLFSASSGEQIKVLAKHGQFADIVFSPDGARIAAADANRVILWDYGTGANRETTMTAYETANIQCLAFSPDGRQLATASEFPPTASRVCIWDINSGKLRFAAVGPRRVNDVAFSADGRQLIAGGNADIEAAVRGGLIVVWDWQTGKRLASFAAHGRGAVTGVAYHPLENTLASCGLDNRIRIWDTESWQQRFEFEFEHGPPDNLLFLPATNSFLASSLTGDVEVLTAASPKEVAQNEWKGWFLRGQNLADAGDWESAKLALTTAIDRNPTSPRPWYLRGQVHAMSENWDLAAADLSKAIDLGNHAALHWHELAIAQLARDDGGAYRRTCEQMVADIYPTSYCATIARATWTCALAPHAIRDMAGLIEAAEEAARIKPTQSYLLCRGAILYRAGRFEEAARVLQQAERGPPDLREDNTQNAEEMFVPAFRWFFLAMTHHQLGHDETAHQWLQQAVEQVAKETREERDHIGPELTWCRRIIYRRLQEEAEYLIP